MITKGIVIIGLIITTVLVLLAAIIAALLMLSLIIDFGRDLQRQCRRKTDDKGL